MARRKVISARAPTSSRKNTEEMHFLSVGMPEFYFTNGRKTVDNFGIKFDNTPKIMKEVVTSNPLDSGFCIYLNKFARNATLRMGLFVPSDQDFDVVAACGSSLKGQIFYFELGGQIKPEKRSLVQHTVQCFQEISLFKNSDGYACLRYGIITRKGSIKIPEGDIYGWLELKPNPAPQIQFSLLDSYFSTTTIQKGYPKEKSVMKIKKKKEIPMRCYSMEHKTHGYCVIICNSTFTDDELERKGAQKDIQAMESLFKKLNFKVSTHCNVVAQEMNTILFHFGVKVDHSNCDAFVCVIMSHGGSKDTVLGSDGEEMKIEQLLSHFKPTSCESLIQKPKIFIVQACRGTLENGTTTKLPKSGRSFRSEIGPSSSMECDKYTIRSDSTISRSPWPDEADFLLAFATPPGYSAYRDTEDGSIFVQALAMVFEDFHEQMHVLDLLTCVHQKVVEETKAEECWQVSAFTSTLTSSLYL